MVQSLPRLLPFTQLTRPHPNSQNPANPAPNNDDLGTIQALGVQNNIYYYILQLRIR